jgi:hypothetical protein
MISIDISTLPFLPLSRLSELPTCSAIYFVLLEGGELLYVGRAVNLNTRWKTHHRYKQFESMESILISWIEVEPLNLDEVEAEFIASLQPKLNWTLIPTEPKPVRESKYQYITGRYGDWFVEYAKDLDMTPEDLEIVIWG